MSRRLEVQIHAVIVFSEKLGPTSFHGFLHRSAQEEMLLESFALGFFAGCSCLYALVVCGAGEFVFELAAEGFLFVVARVVVMAVDLWSGPAAGALEMGGYLLEGWITGW